MDPTSSHQQKKNIENVHFPEATEVKMYTSEQTNTKIDVSRNITAYQNYGREEKIPYESFQNPELYKMRHPVVQNRFENSSSYSEKYVSAQNHDNKLNFKSKHQQDNSLEQTIFFPENICVYSATKSAKSDRTEGEKYNSKARTKPEKECDRKHIIGISCQSCNYGHHYKPSKKIKYQNRVYDIARDSSYICQPVNNKRDTVRINDVVVKDNLVLCCKPRTHKSIYIKPNDEESGTGSFDGYIHPLAEEEIKKDNCFEERNNIYQENPYPEPQQINLNESGLLRDDSLDLGTSLFIQEQNRFNHVNPNEKSIVERKMRCTKLSKKFKCCLWALFYSSVFLLIIGLILLIHVLSHVISRNYINIVIEQMGFVTWVWTVLIISVSIIIFGVYGIVTSIDRGKRILVAYCLTAFILAFLILVFLVFLWILFVNMKDVEYRSMRNTIKIYRCNRYIRNAWDDLQQTYKCCGIEDKGDWKYIPTSCCNATTKQQKLACVKHYIGEQQAFGDGCKSELEHYFFIFFVIAACLLLLAFILLILGILPSLWLLGRYRKVEKCQEVYYISR